MPPSGRSERHHGLRAVYQTALIWDDEDAVREMVAADDPPSVLASSGASFVYLYSRGVSRVSALSADELLAYLSSKGPADRETVSSRFCKESFTLPAPARELTPCDPPESETSGFYALCQGDVVYRSPGKAGVADFEEICRAREMWALPVPLTGTGLMAVVLSPEGRLFFLGASGQVEGFRVELGAQLGLPGNAATDMYVRAFPAGPDAVLTAVWTRQRAWIHRVEKGSANLLGEFSFADIPMPPGAAGMGRDDSVIVRATESWVLVWEFYSNDDSSDDADEDARASQLRFLLLGDGKYSPGPCVNMGESCLPQFLPYSPSPGYFNRFAISSTEGALMALDFLQLPEGLAGQLTTIPRCADTPEGFPRFPAQSPTVVHALPGWELSLPPAPAQVSAELRAKTGGTFLADFTVLPFAALSCVPPRIPAKFFPAAELEAIWGASGDDAASSDLLCQGVPKGQPGPPDRVYSYFGAVSVNGLNMVCLFALSDARIQVWDTDKLGKTRDALWAHNVRASAPEVWPEMPPEHQEPEQDEKPGDKLDSDTASLSSSRSSSPGLPKSSVPGMSAGLPGQPGPGEDEDVDDIGEPATGWPKAAKAAPAWPAGASQPWAIQKSWLPPASSLPPNTTGSLFGGPRSVSPAQAPQAAAARALPHLQAPADPRQFAPPVQPAAPRTSLTTDPMFLADWEAPSREEKALLQHTTDLLDSATEYLSALAAIEARAGDEYVSISVETPSGRREIRSRNSRSQLEYHKALFDKIRGDLAALESQAGELFPGLVRTAEEAQGECLAFSDSEMGEYMASIYSRVDSLRDSLAGAEPVLPGQVRDEAASVIRQLNGQLFLNGQDAEISLLEEQISLRQRKSADASAPAHSPRPPTRRRRIFHAPVMPSSPASVPAKPSDASERARAPGRQTGFRLDVSSIFGGEGGQLSAKPAAATTLMQEDVCFFFAALVAEQQGQETAGSETDGFDGQGWETGPDPVFYLDLEGLPASRSPPPAQVGGTLGTKGAMSRPPHAMALDFALTEGLVLDPQALEAARRGFDAEYEWLAIDRRLPAQRVVGSSFSPVPIQRAAGRAPGFFAGDLSGALGVGRSDGHVPVPIPAGGAPALDRASAFPFSSGGAGLPYRNTGAPPARSFPPAPPVAAPPTQPGAPLGTATAPQLGGALRPPAAPSASPIPQKTPTPQAASQPRKGGDAIEELDDSLLGVQGSPNKKPASSSPQASAKPGDRQTPPLGLPAKPPGVPAAASPQKSPASAEKPAAKPGEKPGQPIPTSQSAPSLNAQFGFSFPQNQFSALFGQKKDGAPTVDKAFGSVPDLKSASGSSATTKTFDAFSVFKVPASVGGAASSATSTPPSGGSVFSTGFRAPGGASQASPSAGPAPAQPGPWNAGAMSGGLGHQLSLGGIGLARPQADMSSMNISAMSQNLAAPGGGAFAGFSGFASAPQPKPGQAPQGQQNPAFRQANFATSGQGAPGGQAPAFGSGDVGAFNF